MSQQFSVDLARHEAHRIGTPFPESDGTVTWPGQEPSSAVARPRVMPAHCNWGRWVVRCNSAWCTNAWMPDLGEAEWRCGVCGLSTVITWPADPIAIEAILLMRPDPNTRNWEPGERLDELIMQNAEHGIYPPGFDADNPDPEGYDVMEQYDGRVVGGLIYGPIEEWRLARGTGPSITAPGEPLTYREIGA